VRDTGAVAGGKQDVSCRESSGAMAALSVTKKLQTERGHEVALKNNVIDP
jgi:hypothetical protein